MEILPINDEAEGAIVVQIRDDVRTDTKQMQEIIKNILDRKEQYVALWENPDIRQEIKENAQQMYPETTEL